MKTLSIERQLELEALQAIFKKILTVGQIYRRSLDEVMGALMYLQHADCQFSNADLQLGSTAVTDRATARSLLRSTRRVATLGLRTHWGYHWDCVEEAAERFNPQLDRPLKEIHAETGSLRPCAPPQIRASGEPQENSMNEIRQHVPDFVSGVEPQVAPFSTLEELKAIPFVARAIDTPHFLRLSTSKVYGNKHVLMLELSTPPIGEHWVLGYLKKRIDLPQWVETHDQRKARERWNEGTSRSAKPLAK